MLSLQRIEESHITGRNLGFCGGQMVSGAAWWESMLAWARLFSQQETSEVAVYANDTLEFLAMLTALWRCRKTAVIPGNNSRHTAEWLRGSGRPLAGSWGEGCDALQKKMADGWSSPPSREASSEDVALVVFTSGTTAKPAMIAKTFWQLQKELSVIEETLAGGREALETVVGSVSHQHFYGLIFRALWPLASGRKLISEARLHPEALIADCKRLARVIVVTSPAQLDRLPVIDGTQKEQQPEPAESGRPLVISAGAPLMQDAASRAESVYAAPVIDIYGTSETGVIAYRRAALESAWRAILKVRVNAASGSLQVKGAQVGEGRWLEVGDRAEMLSENTFRLLGRKDRVIKIAGKRHALDFLERALLEHPWVLECRVLPLPARSDRLGALVKLSKEGGALLADKPKSELNAALRRHMLGYVEAVAVPRYWRYWHCIPTNQQGKVNAEEIRAMFLPNGRPRYARVVQCDTSPDTAQLKLYVPHSLTCFDGHFHGSPVLAGIVQLDWAVFFCRQHLVEPKGFRGLRQVKFMRVIFPGADLNLDLQYRREKHMLQFQYLSGDKTASSGQILFSAEE